MTDVGRRLALAALALLLSTSQAPSKASEQDRSAWDDVQAFRGRYECEELSLQEGPLGPGKEVARSESRVVLDFEIERDGNGWRVVSSRAVGGRSSSQNEDGPWRRASSSSASSFSGPVAGGDLSFRLDTRAGRWEFSAGGRLAAPYVETTTLRKEEWKSGSWTSESSDTTRERRDYPHAGMREALPDPKSGSLDGVWETRDDERDAGRFDYNTGHKRARVTLTPVWPDYEVVVKVEGVGPKGEATPYEEWLPQGTVDEKVGARLKVTARLRPKGAWTTRAVVREFGFRLKDTSREPGVSMNWPLVRPVPGNAKSPPPDEEYDLRFDGRSGPATSKRQIQTVEPLADGNGRPYAEAGIECYDYGGWATLEVMAELYDGRTIVGHLEEDSGIAAIPLPKRSGPSVVADAWKKSEGVSADDRDDGEKEPEGEPGCDGDGLTLYEEYRGFFENGRHVRTDPKRKDLFVHNRCGSVAVPGIMLFQKLTGLRVRRGMLEDEHADIPYDYTAINGYVDRGPHRVLQHRIDIIYCGPTWPPGGRTSASAEARDRHLRPKDVEGIWIEDAGADFWTEQYGISTSDRPRQFDVAVAHELLHAVGVEHHGEGDDALKFEVSKEDSPTGRPTWGYYTGGTYVPVRFWQENPLRDITEISAAEKLGLVDEKMRLVREKEPEMVDGWTQRGGLFVNTMQIGVESGQHSGDAQCVMRYWLANVYPKKGSKDRALILVPDGTEPVGAGLCRSTAGTSVNKAGRTPQPRYFDAAPGRGDCKHWICVNDGIPAKSNEIPESKK